MATLYYNGGSFNNAAGYFNDEAGTDPAGRVPTIGDTVYLVTDSMPGDSEGDVLTCDVFHGSNPSTVTAFAWFSFATFNCDVYSFNCYWTNGATVNGVFTPTELNPQSPTIGASGALDVSPIPFFMWSGYQLSDLVGTLINGRVINWSGKSLYADTSDAVANPADVRDGVSNLGVEGTLEVSADCHRRVAGARAHRPGGQDHPRGRRSGELDEGEPPGHRHRREGGGGRTGGGRCPGRAGHGDTRASRFTTA